MVWQCIRWSHLKMRFSKRTKTFFSSVLCVSECDKMLVVRCFDIEFDKISNIYTSILAIWFHCIGLNFFRFLFFFLSLSHLVCMNIFLALSVSHSEVYRYSLESFIHIRCFLCLCCCCVYVCIFVFVSRKLLYQWVTFVFHFNFTIFPFYIDFQCKNIVRHFWCKNDTQTTTNRMVWTISSS